MALAEEKSTGFLDMTGTWHEFVKDSDKGVDFFRRDPLHANHRGQEVLARNIDGYFAAVVPEPVGATTVSLLALWTLASRRRRS